MSIHLIISLILFTFIAAFHLEKAVLLIILLLPSYLIRFHLLGIPFTFLEAMIIISFSFWFIKTTKLKLGSWLKNRKKRFPYPFAKEIIIILVAAFISSLITNFSSASLGILKAYFFEPIMLYILILNILPGKSGRNKIINMLALSALVTALFAILQKYTGIFIFNDFWQATQTRRVVSWFGYPNAIGLFLAPIIMIIAGQLAALKKDKSRKYYFSLVFFSLTIISSLLAIYFAHSEGALIALLASTFVFIFFSGRVGKIITSASFVILFLSVIFIPSLKTLAIDKLTLQDLSGEIRKQQWRETMMTINKKSFILGNGLSNYQETVTPFHQEGIFFNRDKMENFHSILYGNAQLRAKYWQPVEIYMYPHNIVLNFWSELGLLGLLGFIILIIKFIVKSFLLFKKNNNLLALGLLSAMLTIIIHGLVDVPYLKNDLSVQFFIILSLLASLILDQKALKEIKI
ncbi:MAG: O-antigen ligase family protein [Patescibacteria group bacterium]|nr:O-antigen ligase family protein [Patescibacteria group bacterium]MDD3778262.1 O-antigen ligase family protein [Patescibacteria group bacterium]MDD3939614.1 O-antigen ligase family protein [Patescibacteria group bacterium]MDD4443665.1 O-antigen ligase family protein [Patescibacteria group bacterium]